MNPDSKPSEQKGQRNPDAIEETRRDNRYVNFDPNGLSNKFYDSINAEDAFDKIDRLLEAEDIVEEFELAGEYSVAVGYPDIYENGIANLSHQVLYSQINQYDDWFATRTYTPSKRLKKALINSDQPYFTWEDRKPLDEHDILTFTLSFEELAPKLLSILDYSDIPTFAKDRKDEDPIVICGGTTANYNPEPYADFIDCFYIGEARVGVPAILNAYEEAAEKGHGRRKTLKRLCREQGVYVPSFYEVEYSENGELLDMVALEPEAAGKVYKTVDESLVDHPAHSVFITDNIIYDEQCYALEVQRGCAYSCNFCQHGHNNGSSRWMGVNDVIDHIKSEAINHADIIKLFYEATDPGYLDELFAGIEELEANYDIEIRLGAFTANQLTERMIRVAAEGGQQCIIVAPEAASGDMRYAVGKEGFYEDEEVFRHARWSAKHGVPNFGLYLLFGIPGETDQDIADLSEFISETRDHVNSSGILEIHINPVFPKPLTPFQWARMERPEHSIEKLNYLVERLEGKGHNIVVDAVSKAVIGAGYLAEAEQTEETDIVIKTITGTKMHYSQPILARGDRRVGSALFDAYCAGDTYEAWQDALKKNGLDDEAFFRSRGEDETLPWGFIHNTVSPGLRENKWESVKSRVSED